MKIGEERVVMVKGNVNESSHQQHSGDTGSQVGSAAGRSLVSDASSIYYTTSRYRWVVLWAVFSVNLVNAALWLTYSPISDAIAAHFDVSTNSVNMLSLCLSATYGPVVWAAAPCVKRFGFAWSVRIAAVLTGLGGIVRFFGTDHDTFFLLILGQVLSGLARPFISQLLGLVSLHWFPNHQRVLATAIAALGNPFGIGLGMGLSPVIVKANVLDTSTLSDQIKTLNLIHMIIGSLMMVSVCLLIRERPKHDPSEAAIAARLPENQIPFKSEVKLLYNKQYWIVAFAFGFGFGQLNCTAVIINQMLKPFGYSRSAVGFAGVMTILPGVAGAGIVAAFLGKRPYHREALIIIYFLGAILLQGMILVALRDNSVEKYGNLNVFLLGSAGMFGFFSQPCFSVALELASETVYPASPSIASAGVVMMGQYVGLVMSLGLGHYIGSVPKDVTLPPGMTPSPTFDDHTLDQQDRVHIAGYIQSASWVAAGLLMIFFKKDNLARMKYEQEEKAKKKALKNEEKRRLRGSRKDGYSTLNASAYTTGEVSAEQEA